MKCNNCYKLYDRDWEILRLALKGVEQDNDGSNARDVMDEGDMIDAMRLLIAIVDAGHAA